MKLKSTNHQSPPVSLRKAVMEGLAPDGGLYMPTELPRLPDNFFKRIQSLSFQEIAFEVARVLMKEEIEEKDLKTIVYEAIDFDAPLVHLSDTLSVLELFHGPTLAFKDFGARFMARLMRYFLKNNDHELAILVATSGDTGSAVAHGFFEVPGIHVVLLYPSGKVSEIQEKQLTTLGGNVTALEVQGTFDDCQRLVKEAFLNEDLKSKTQLSSANSINIARLIPQSFYYFYAYAQLKDKTKPVIISVPSGNFGNLTAGLMAKKMGLPVSRFIAACNANEVVPHYLKTGQFQPKSSKKTLSNAMDVGNPSNFARIHALYGGDLEKIRVDMWGHSFSDTETQQAIQEVHQKYGTILDPHGAVGYLGLKAFNNEHEGRRNGIFLATAHPAKFLDIVEPVIGGKIEIPQRLRECLNKSKQSTVISNQFQDFKQFLLKKTLTK